MILTEAKAREKTCGQSMAHQHGPKKCQGSDCMWWVQVSVLTVKGQLEPEVRGCCGMLRRYS